MQMADKKRLVILDTHAILHRAYHALPDFSSSKGEPTGALYGLISMLVKIVADLKPDYIAAAFDLPGETYRHVAFKEYKAKRQKADDALVAQIIRSRDVLGAFGIPRYEKEGFEADDVIGTIVEEIKRIKNPPAGGVEIVIASGDMDTLQLVDGKKVQVFMPKKGLSDPTLWDAAAVKVRFAFDPELIPDYKGLRGDPSDNIPGVKGVGEKTAMALVAQFGSLEDIYKVLKKNPEKALEAGVKQGMIDKILEQEEQAYFSKELAQIRHDAPIDFVLPKHEWRESVESEKVLDMLAEFDFRSLIPRVKEMLGGNYGGAASQKVLGSPSPGRPDFSQGNPASVPQEEIDKLSIAVWVLDSNITEPTLDDIYRVGKSKDFEKAKKHILAQIEEKDLSYVYEKIELPLMPVLRRMETQGILVDRAFLKKLSHDYHQELQKIAARIYAAAGKEFNINSPKQLGDVLFDTLGLAAKNQKKTAGGARSTKESELQKLKDQHPIIEDILAHRELQKLLSTYIDTIPTLLDDADRLHTSYIQASTTTGRLSSQDPNLQNIPIKTELGRAIRHAFVAPKGMELVSFDYSQIELRIAAMLSGDPGLIEIFKEGRDVHAEVAMRIFKVGEKDVTYEQRRRAKVINFGILYGMGVNALQQSLGTTRKEAQEFYGQYFDAFPRLAAYIETTKEDASRLGYTQTLFGRRRYLDGIRSPIPYVRAAAERMAVNAPMQGTQADLVKLAMVEIDDLFEKEGLREKAHLLLQVHDELVFEIEKNIISTLAPKIKKIMEGVLPHKDTRGVPTVAEGKAGKNWGDMHKI